MNRSFRNIARRVLLTLPVLWLVVSVVFLLIHLVPGDPIVQMLGDGATAADISALRHAYGLDAPLSTAVSALLARRGACGPRPLAAAE